MTKDSMVNAGSKNISRLINGSQSLTTATSFSSPSSPPTSESKKTVAQTNIFNEDKVTKISQLSLSKPGSSYTKIPYQRNVLKSIGDSNQQLCDHSKTMVKNYIEKPNQQKPTGLSTLLSFEANFNIDISQIIYINSEHDERIDGRLREESLMDLLSLHRAFYSLDSVTFAKAVCLVDSFINKIKFKPKYIMCVSAACYYIASKFEKISEESLHPTRDNLIRLYRCPGTKEDLNRMIEIIIDKLSPAFIKVVGETNATSINFVEKFFEILEIHNPSSSEFNGLLKSFSRKLEIMLCIPSVTKYRPACQALSLLYGSCPDVNNGLEKIEGLTPVDILNLAHSCQLDWSEVEECYTTFIKDSRANQLTKSLGRGDEENTFFNGNGSLAYSQFSGSPPIRWNLSKRTRISMHKIASLKPKLSVLIEDESEQNSILFDDTCAIRPSKVAKTEQVTTAEEAARHDHPLDSCPNQHHSKDNPTHFQTDTLSILHQTTTTTTGIIIPSTLDTNKNNVKSDSATSEKINQNNYQPQQEPTGLSQNSLNNPILTTEGPNLGESNLINNTSSSVIQMKSTKPCPIPTSSTATTTTIAAALLPEMMSNKLHKHFNNKAHPSHCLRSSLFNIHNHSTDIQLPNNSVYSQPNYQFCEEINDSICGLLTPLLIA